MRQFRVFEDEATAELSVRLGGVNFRHTLNYGNSLAGWWLQKQVTLPHLDLSMGGVLLYDDRCFVFRRAEFEEVPADGFYETPCASLVPVESGAA